jgi:uracil phosphoribosyltransferase
MKNVTVIAQPLVQHHLTRLRDRRTPPQEFRRRIGQITAGWSMKPRARWA